MWFKRQRKSELASCNYCSWKPARILVDCLQAQEMQPRVFKWPNNWDLGFMSPVRHNHWCRVPGEPQTLSCLALLAAHPTTKHWPEPHLLCKVIFLPTVVQLQGFFNHSSASAACKHLMSSQRTSFIHFMVPRMQRYLPNFLRNINIKGWLSQPKSCKLNKVLLTFHDKVINNTKKKNEMIPDYKLL